MTQRELFAATLAHRSTGRFLYYAGFIAETEAALRKYVNMKPEESVAERFGCFVQQNVTLREPDGHRPPSFERYFADMERPAGARINWLGVLEIPGSVFHFTHYVSPLRNCGSVAEMADFPFPSAQGYTDGHMAAEVAALHDEGLIARTWVGHQYENAWQVRGYEEFLMDMALCPEVPHFVMAQMQKPALARAVAAARAGCDMISTGDDVANQRALMFKPEQWRTFIKAYWKPVYDQARAIKPDIAIWYHSDGNIAAILPELVELGVSVLNPVQPECLDVHALKERFGAQLVLDGVIGTQSTMPFGSPAQVKAAVRQAKRDLGYDGALILSPTHVLEPDVPPRNITAFFEACAE